MRPGLVAVHDSVPVRADHRCFLEMALDAPGHPLGPRSCYTTFNHLRSGGYVTDISCMYPRELVDAAELTPSE